MIFSICCAEQPEYVWSIALEEILINLATLDYEVCCMLQPKVVNGSFVISASGLTEA